MTKRKKHRKLEQISSPIQVEEKVRYSLVPSKEFGEDFRWWISTDSKTTLKIVALIEDTLQDPFKGLGKPEPLRHVGSGIWSRRINDVDRFVYKVDDGKVKLLQCRYHYDD